MLQLMQVLQLAQQPTQKLSVSNAESSVFPYTLSAKITKIIRSQWMESSYMCNQNGSIVNDYVPVVFVSKCVCFPQIVIIL